MNSSLKVWSWCKLLDLARQSLAAGLLVAVVACSSKGTSDANNGGAPSSAQAGSGGLTVTGAGGMGATSAAGGTVATGTAGGAGANPNSNTEPFINPAGKLNAAGNSFGLQGYWYAYADGVTSTQTGNPYRDGKYCVTGTAPGDRVSDHWGVGLGLDLNNPGTKMSYAYKGKITGFRMKLEGSTPSPVRVNFVTNADSSGVAPFIVGTLGQSVVYNIADAQVPLDWGVANAGERVADSLYALQVLAPGSDAAGAIDLCITEFEPVYAPGGTTPVDGAYLNKDGFVRQENNPFGIQGPVLVIGDGTSNQQTGNPYKDGKYCVSGTFSGATADWGAGIVFYLNRMPGSDTKAPYDFTGKVAGFRIGLSGNSPGPVRVQFVLDEPQMGNQPMLVGRLNAKADYRIAWAQVPTSWKVSDAGRVVGSTAISVQVYLDGSVAGPFSVCVDDFLPLAAADLPRAAQAAATGYTGFRTIDDTALTAEYALWKQRRLKDCNDGTACVPRDEGDCISEGIAYGMLLSAGNDDKATFDKLWGYFKKNKNANGVMKWQTTACGAASAEGSATDGELDAAMALIQASCRWGTTYADDAKQLIGAIKNTELTTCNGSTVLKPGDNFGGCDRTNPSYIAPGYYKAFATFTNDTSWNTVASDGYKLLASLQAAQNGLVPNWSNASGTPATGDDGKYGPDASRTPWRVATDYAWFNEPKAVTFLNNLASYVDANGGVARLFVPNSAFRGGLAMSALPAASTKAQEYSDAWLQTSVDDNTYFPGTLRPLYMLLLANKFPKSCN